MNRNGAFLRLLSILLKQSLNFKVSCIPQKIRLVFWSVFVPADRIQTPSRRNGGSHASSFEIWAMRAGLKCACSFPFFDCVKKFLTPLKEDIKTQSRFRRSSLLSACPIQAKPQNFCVPPNRPMSIGCPLFYFSQTSFFSQNLNFYFIFLFLLFLFAPVFLIPPIRSALFSQEKRAGKKSPLPMDSFSQQISFWHSLTIQPTILCQR